MKHKFSWMVWACLLCLSALAACSDLELDYDKQQPTDRGVWLSFNIDGLTNGNKQTRSTLQSSEVNYQDVKDVHLYVFNDTTADAICIHDEKLDWKGNITQKHWVSIDLQTGKPYTFMAVGCDRKLGDKVHSIYGFPGNIVKGQTKLGECKARVQDLQAAGNATVNVPDSVAHEQFFVATQNRVIKNKVEEVALTLRRKVAGILVYLRNIPTRVAYKDNAWDVKRLQVCLHKNQSTEVALWKEYGKKDVYGTGDLKDSKVLFDVDLKNEGFTDSIDNKKLDYFTRAGNDSMLADSYLAGAYLLPLDAEKGKATLSVNLIGEYHSGEGQFTEEQVLKTYEVYYHNPETNTRSTDFPIKENTLYAIGKKLSNSTTSGDKPADLSGNLLELEVLPWDTIKLDNVFPVVTGPARIEADYNDEKYIFNAWDDSLMITIKPAVNKDGTPVPWKLKVNYEPGNEEFNEKPTDWIHFANYDENGEFVEYTNEVQGDGSKEVKVKVLINDYAVQRASTPDFVYTPGFVEKVKKDIRKAKLEVYTEGSDKPYTLQIQQYNTLTICCKSTKKGARDTFRGIARLDYDCEYDYQTGELIVGESAQIYWGYFRSGNIYVSGENPMNYFNGEVTSDLCYNRYRLHDDGWKGYLGSSIQKLTRRFRNLETIEENGKKEVVDKNPANNDDHEKEKNWYLPAYYEMWGVSDTFRNQYEALGYTKGTRYWTSSGDNGWYKDAYITELGSNEDDRRSWQWDKDDLHHAMYMVHFE